MHWFPIYSLIYTTFHQNKYVTQSVSVTRLRKRIKLKERSMHVQGFSLKQNRIKVEKYNNTFHPLAHASSQAQKEHSRNRNINLTDSVHFKMLDTVTKPRTATWKNMEISMEMTCSASLFTCWSRVCPFAQMFLTDEPQ